MGFQFQCPQGHLLEADPANTGQQSVCPICGTVFLIPAPMGPAQGPFAGPSSPPPYQDPIQFPMPQFLPPAGPQSGEPEGFRIVENSSAQGATAPTDAASDQPLHIPCPNGHELEVPKEMLDQDALCPTCQVQFRLRAKDSLEHKRRQQEAYERRQHKLAKAWLNWSVAIAVIVVLGLLALIGLRTYG